ncbi:uncharacterized protein TrAtP1_004267 [Trichoderma atroviride]|uniref:uncharacterized protein n=1 Tax=Hypocrea atroviridis TaxID=63577 RepID=UPI00331CC4A8|nr:hypothetical protein TrAtP1_004267 [Trichoderma atroviride]
MDSSFFAQNLRRRSGFSLRPGHSLFSWDGSEPSLEYHATPQLPQWAQPSGLLLPQTLSIIKPCPDVDGYYPMDMASVLTTGASSGSSNKQIPLLCTVCPETPRFSDVSHLLTHIASKGHLHHETQTKLKSHQDIAASISLQQYEQWYKDNGIEGLLVERMKAKQLKEATRNKRARGATSALNSSKQPKRRIKRTESDTPVKNERKEYPVDFPVYPGFFPSDNENDPPDELFVPADMMALKGQVWPGMGKMDLANEDMKRTRNQRKPKSAIEKMRRTSEGIEPTQVVMTAEFEVERIKDVYDSSSPVPDQEEATPLKKVAKPRRKRGEPLAEISANVPRGNSRRITRSNLGQGKSSKPLTGYSRTSSSDITPLGQFKRSHDIFRDEDTVTGLYDNRPLFDLRGRVGLHQLNPISHSNLVSPTPQSRDIPDRSFSGREINRGRGQEQPYLSMGAHAGLGALNHSDLSYALNGTSIYNNTPRFTFASSNHFNTLSHDHFRLSSGHHAQHKLDDFSNPGTNDAVSATNQFLDMPGANPLFSQDRLFFGSGSAQNLSSLGFTSINRDQDAAHSMRQNHDQSQSAANIKLEPQLCDVLDEGNIDDEKESRYSVHGLWEPQGSDNGVDINEDLRHDELEL